MFNLNKYTQNTSFGYHYQKTTVKRDVDIQIGTEININKVKILDEITTIIIR